MHIISLHISYLQCFEPTLPAAPILTGVHFLNKKKKRTVLHKLLNSIIQFYLSSAWFLDLDIYLCFDSGELSHKCYSTTLSLLKQSGDACDNLCGRDKFESPGALQLIRENITFLNLF